MRDVLDHSWALLDEADRRIFAALSVFRSGFSAETAKRVAGASLRQLRSFVEKSLLQRVGDDRYAIHELLRQYASEQLDGMPALAAEVRNRHCLTFAEAVHAWNLALRGEEQLNAMEAFVADIDDVRVAWNHGLQVTQTSLLRQMVEGLCSYYEWRSLYESGEAVCRSAIARLEEMDADDGQTIAQLQLWHGVFLRVLGNVKEAARSTSDALARLDRLERTGEDVTIRRAIALHRMAEITGDGDRPKAERLWRQSLLLLRQRGDRWWRSQVEDALGLMLFSFGRPEQARELLESSLAAQRLLGDRRGMARSLTCIAQVLKTQGHTLEALRFDREAVAMCEALGDRYGATRSRFEMATTLMYMGRFAEATPLLQETARDFEELGARKALGFVVHIQGWNYTNLGQYDRARHFYQVAKSIFESLAEKRGIAVNNLGLGGIALARRELDRAQQHLFACASGMRALDQHDEHALALANLALVGHRDGALAYVREALRIAAPIQAFAPARCAIHAYALLLADQGSVARGVELYTLVMQQPYFGNSVFRQDIIGDYMDAYAAGLPCDARCAAKARGRARELWRTVDEILAEQEQSV